MYEIKKGYPRGLDKRIKELMLCENVKGIRNEDEDTYLEKGTVNNMIFPKRVRECLHRIEVL